MSPKGRPAIASLGSRLPDFSDYCSDGMAQVLADRNRRCECSDPFGYRDRDLGWRCLRCGHVVSREHPPVASS